MKEEEGGGVSPLICTAVLPEAVNHGNAGVLPKTPTRQNLQSHHSR